MNGSLAAFQSNLGRALLGADCCPIDPRSAGFCFTMAVRRSWCEGRSISAAQAVLRVMPDDDRQRLVSEYVNQGGGLEWFLSSESEKFLSFLAERLPEPSHALTVCRMSQALAHARLGALMFVPQQPVGVGPIDRGRHAALVWFPADPAGVRIPFENGQSTQVCLQNHAILFAPGLPNLFRIATEAEVALWDSLPVASAPAAVIGPLLIEGVLAYRAECR
jgi:hypothetical protein